MGKVTRPMLTASAVLRLTPAEKRKLVRLARDRNVSLSYALREGARLWLEETVTVTTMRERDTVDR